MGSTACSVRHNYIRCYSHLSCLPGRNYFSGLIGILLPGYLIMLAELPEGVLKVNEVAPGVVAGSKLDDTTSLEPSSLSSAPAPPSASSVLSFLGNGFELIWNVRGVGWKFGQVAKVHIAKDWRDLSDRSTFLRQTVQSIFWNFLVLDITNSILAHADLRRPGGSTLRRGNTIVESLLISSFYQVLIMTYVMTCEDDLTLLSSLLNLTYPTISLLSTQSDWAYLLLHRRQICKAGRPSVARGRRLGASR